MLPGASLIPHCFVLIAVTLAFPAALAQSPASTPKPTPEPGARGTVDFWEKQLQGKFKPQVKADLGTPTGGIEQNGDIYIYKSEFFHPDLDEWRDLRITFSSKDGAVESFTGSGGDTKPYAVTAPLADVVAPPTPTPTPPPSLDELKSKLERSVVTVEFTEPDASADYTAGAGAGATGFLISYNGKPYVATVIHALEGEASTEIAAAWHHGPRKSRADSQRMPSRARVKTSFEDFLKLAANLPLPKVKANSGSEIKLGKELLFSKERDLVLIPVEAQAATLSISETPPLLQQKLLISGNAEAAHTLSTFEAEVSRVGPDRIEVAGIPGDKAKPGMSGGPVVDAKHGHVIGAIAYVVEGAPDWLKDEIVSGGPGGNATVIRIYQTNFRNTAFRIDNLSDLEPISWARFVQDCAILLALRERTLNVRWASLAINAAKGTEPAYELTPDFDNHVYLTYSSFVRDFPRLLTTQDPVYRLNAWQTYQRKLEQFLRTDLDDPRFNIVTPYVKRLADTITARSRQETVLKLRAEAGKVQ